MVLRPTCMVYPPLASQSQANWKLEGQSTKQCSTSSNECLTTFIMTEDTVIISNVTGFFSPAETHPLDAICFEAFAEQSEGIELPYIVQARDNVMLQYLCDKCYRQEKEDEELNKPLSRSNIKENQLWVLEKHRGFQESGHLLFAFFGCLHISLSCLRYYIRHSNMITVLRLSYYICRLVVFLLYYVKVYLDPFVTILVPRNQVTYKHFLMSKG